MNFISNIVLAIIWTMSVIQIIAAVMICIDHPYSVELRVKIKERPKWRVRLFHFIDVSVLVLLAGYAWWFTFAIFILAVIISYTAEKHIEGTSL